nr:zinc finger, CCHC-type [Tanacetum cinerariifolium]
MTKSKGDGGEGLYVTGIYGQRDIEPGKGSAWSRNEDQTGCDVGYLVYMKSMTMVMYCWVMAGNVVKGGRRTLISLGTLENEGFTIKMQSGKMKVIKSSLVVQRGIRRAKCVYTLDGQGPTQQYINSGVAKGLGVAGIHLHNGLVKEINMTLLAKVELKEDHIFEVEPQANVDHVVGSQYRGDNNDAAFAVADVTPPNLHNAAEYHFGVLLHSPYTQVTENDLKRDV